MNAKISVVGVLLAGMGTSQHLVDALNSGGESRLRQTDLAALESGTAQNGLPCVVVPMKPELDLDFVFHGGFQVLVPFKSLNLKAAPNELTVLFRVIAQNRPGDPVYMSQRVEVPRLAANEKETGNGVGEFYGAFLLGEGKYHVDWLMRDREEHVCATSWDVEAKLNTKELPAKPWIADGLIQPAEADLFREEPPVPRDPGDGLLNVDIVVNFAARNPHGTTLDSGDLRSLIAILRKIARDPHIGSYSLVACSFAKEQVLYRQENASRMPLPDIGEALKSLNFGIIDAKRLAVKDGPAHFFADVIRTQQNHSGSDAFILVGTKTNPAPTVSREIVDALKELGRPVFYLTYNADPLTNPWRDRLWNAVKQAHGFEYEIIHPHDLFNAWSDVVARLVKAKGLNKTSAPTGR